MPARSVACDECKWRKVRCSAHATCTNCIRDRKTCVYSSAPHRAAALQETVSRYESLLESIDKVWATHLPHLTLAQALAGETAGPSRSTGNRPTAHDVHRQQPQHDLASSSIPPVLSPSVSEGTPEQNNPEDYEFDESHDLNHGADGMSFLTAGTRKAGYLGPPSSLTALRLLRSLPHGSHIEDSDEVPLRTADPLPPASESNDTCITQYFTYYHAYCPLLHEGLFRARLSGAVAKPRDGSWPLVLNMVLAMGAFVGSESDVDLHYYRLARESISLSIIEKGSLCYVQGLTIMADYLQKRNKPNAGFALIGIAWSMAMAIGLHREFGYDLTTPYTMEQRRRTWWTLYAFVSSAQLTLGRPPASLVGINLRLPTNLNDTSLVVDMTDLPEPAEGPTVTACIIEQIKLAQIGNEVQTELLANQVPATHKVNALRRQLDLWKAGLPACFEDATTCPAWFELPKRVLLWRAHHLSIVLSRPFLFRAVSEKADLTQCEGPVWECINTADSCINAICDFLASNSDWGRGFAWYATYWLISASFIHATCFAYTSAGRRKEQWRLRLQQAADALKLLKSAHSMAQKAQQMLERLIVTSTQGADSTVLGGISGAWDPAGEPSLVNFSVNYMGLGNAGQPSHPNPSLETMVPTAGDIYSYPWFQYEAQNAELLDAAGGITLQNW